VDQNERTTVPGTAAGEKSQVDWLAEAVRIMARLRAEGGCPWDRQQTHESLKRYLVEETAEACTLAELEALWDKAKAEERDAGS